MERPARGTTETVSTGRGDEMEVITSDDDGSLHLVGDNNTPKFTINSALGSLLLINIVFWELSGYKTRWNSSARMSLP